MVGFGGLVFNAQVSPLIAELDWAPYVYKVLQQVWRPLPLATKPLLTRKLTTPNP